MTTVEALAATSAVIAVSTVGRGSDCGSCSTTGTNWPTEARPWAASVAALASGASGRKPSGPNSVAAMPTSRIWVSTTSGSSWWPQPGTSHTPHEMGAPATRWASGERADIGSRLHGGDLGHLDEAPLGARELARLGDPERLEGVADGAGARA